MKSLVIILFVSSIFSEPAITDSSIIINPSLNSSKLDTVKIDSLITASDHNQFKKGSSFCKKHNIEFIEAQRTEFQDNINQVFNSLSDPNLEYILYLHQDCFPVS